LTGDVVPNSTPRALHYRAQAKLARERAKDTRFAEVAEQYEQVARQWEALADNVEKTEARWRGWIQPRK